MSEKQSKKERNTLMLPTYDLQKQLDYIKSICLEFQFDNDRLMSYIIADFIFGLQYTIMINGDDGKAANDAFFSYLANVKKTYDNFMSFKAKYDDKQINATERVGKEG